MNLSEVNWELSAAGTWPLPVKSAITVLVCIIVVGAWIYVDTMDQLDGLKQVESKEQELRSSFEIKQTKAANLEEYKQQLSEMEDSLGEMLRQLPNRSEVANLLVDVSQTGLASGLEFELFRPQPEIKKDFYAELPIDINVVGTFKELGLFISGLAELPRIVTVHNIGLQPRGTKGDMGMTAIVKTYRYLSENDSGGGAGNTTGGR